MNIQEAKSEVIHTIMAYTAKNDWGGYAIPSLRQRPLLLIGPPGIGKTAIMEQAASACKVGFVSYTMTHHTRQSAMGLPFIEHKTFDGRDYAVTEYTMSEIIASVFNRIEETGCREGLLFLDEINCVSETLAPAMLQFLQNKTFGSHRLPDGWILAAAGNPAEYNKSVREFDIATLDRLKYIQVEADYPAWRSYALESGIHGSILSYLDTHQDQFYVLKQSYNSKVFATARGWEDLSCLLFQYEALGLPVTFQLVEQYLHCEELARDFSGYYHWFRSRENSLPLLPAMTGDPEAFHRCRELLTRFSTDEKLQLVHLILSCIFRKLKDWELGSRQSRLLSEHVEKLERYQKQQKLSSPADALPGFLKKEQEILRIRQEHGLSTESEIRSISRSLYHLQSLIYEALSRQDCRDKTADLKEQVAGMQKDTLEAAAETLLTMVTCAIDLLTTDDGPEFTVFLSSLSGNTLALSFLENHPCSQWEKYKSRLQFQERENELKKELQSTLLDGMG